MELRWPFLAFVVATGLALGWHLARLRSHYATLLQQGTPPNEPLPLDRLTLYRDTQAGLPEGSIRAAIALFVVLVALPALVFAPALGLGSTGELGTVLGGVLGFYFGTRSNGSGDPEGLRAAAAGATTRAAAAAATAADAAAATAQLGDAAAALTAARGAVRDAAAVAGALGGLLPGSVGDTLRTADPLVAMADTALARASTAASAIEAAIAAPSAASIAAAIAGTRQAITGTGDNGLGTLLTGAIGALGAALPTIGGLAAGVTPVGLAGAVMLGGVQAWRVGAQHYARWTARVLDRPVTRELLPDAAWDGAAALALLPAAPSFERAYGPALRDAPLAAAAALLAACFSPDAIAHLTAGNPAEGLPPAPFDEHGFASEAELEAGLHEYRRAALDTELDRGSTAPIPPAGLSPEAFRALLDRLRETPARADLDRLALATHGLLRAGDSDAERVIRAALERQEARPGRA